MRIKRMSLRWIQTAIPYGADPRGGRMVAYLVNALKSLGIDTECHLYKNLGHGFGLGIGTNAEGWLNDAVKFWEKHMK